MVAVGLTSCGGDDVKREPGSIYMPDMAYSRAYETYADHSNLKAKGINYTNQPVAGSVSRTDAYVYQLAKDLGADTTNYVASAAVQSPVQQLTEGEMAETVRLYNINCAICHGEKLDGNGPLYKDGNGPYPAKPATLKGDAKYEAMSEGTMFHAVTYGRNLMGSYASQLTPMQRWNIVHYIKVQQGKKSNGTADSVIAAKPAAMPATDSAATR